MWSKKNITGQASVVKLSNFVALYAGSTLFYPPKKTLSILEGVTFLQQNFNNQSVVILALSATTHNEFMDKCRLLLKAVYIDEVAQALHTAQYSALSKTIFPSLPYSKPRYLNSRQQRIANMPQPFSIDMSLDAVKQIIVPNNSPSLSVFECDIFNGMLAEGLAYLPNDNSFCLLLVALGQDSHQLLELCNE